MHVTNFNLKATLESGQFFRFKQEGNKFLMQTRDKEFWIQQNKNELEFKGVTESFVKQLFSLDENHHKIIKELSHDKKLRPALQKNPGIRIMRQDPWECLVAFVCSQNNNIKRIKQNMEDISGGGRFPAPGELKNLDKFKLGYRTKYLQAINKLVTDKSLSKLKKVPYEQAKKELMKLPGVGKKVADCVCLFALGHTKAFPVDVWITRVMKELYGLEAKQILSFAWKKWEKNAGYAQQYLYHWRRLT